LLCVGLFFTLLGLGQSTYGYFSWQKLADAPAPTVLDVSTVKRALETMALTEAQRQLLLTTIRQQQDGRVSLQEVLVQSAQNWRSQMASLAFKWFLAALVFGALLVKTERANRRSE